MGLMDRLKGVGRTVGASVREAFADPAARSLLDELDADLEAGLARSAAHGEAGGTLDVASARRTLGVADTATLADVREAARARARRLQPSALRDGVHSEAARALTRELEALELLEQALLPLGGGGAAAPSSNAAPDAPRRQRATPRVG